MKAFICFWSGDVIIFNIAAADNDAEPQGWQSSIDIEKLENEFVLTSAEYMLSLVNVKWTFSGKCLFFSIVRESYGWFLSNSGDITC